jgi:hypothetical protein
MNEWLLLGISDRPRKSDRPQISRKCQGTAVPLEITLIR